MPFELPKSTRLADLLAKKLPPAIPIIHPWLHSGESCLLWAGTGVGKSMIAQTIALAAAGGGKVLGWDFPRPTGVLYIDGEQSERAIQGRFHLLFSTITGGDAEKAGDNLRVMARATQETPGGFFDMADGDHRGEFLAFVRKEKFGLIVFDNFSTLSDTVEDENSAAAMKPMQVLLTHLKKQNVAVIVVHHSGKDPNRYRGSSNIATTFERILAVRRNEAASPTRIDATVTLEKFRDEIPDGFRPTFPVTFSTTTDTNGKRAQWEVGDLGLLEDAWAMFATGSFTTKAGFVAAVNKRFGTKFKAGNFQRDFETKWIGGPLQKQSAEVRKAEQRMKDLRKREMEDGPAALVEEF